MRFLSATLLTLSHICAFAHPPSLAFTPLAAHELMPPRLDGKIHVEVLVIIEAGEKSPQYAIIRHTINSKNYKKWLNNLIKIRKLNIKNKHTSAILNRTFEATRDDGPSDFIEFWDTLPGVNLKLIPFGQTVPVFFSESWPSS